MDERNASIETVYENLWWSEDRNKLFTKLHPQILPRPFTVLDEKLEELGLNKDSRLLDIGCGGGIHTTRLAKTFGCHITAFDLVQSNVDHVLANAKKAGLDHLIEVQQGSVEEMPFEDASFDFLWCLDTLEHVPNLQKALAECRRVVKPGGAMLLFTTFGTEHLEPKEQAALYKALNFVPASLVVENMDQALKAAGWQVYLKEDVGGELTENFEESDGRFALELVRISRMRRARDKFVAEVGEERYNLIMALYHWGIYLLLGKLSPTLYLLKP